VLDSKRLLCLAAVGAVLGSSCRGILGAEELPLLNPVADAGDQGDATGPDADAGDTEVDAADDADTAIDADSAIDAHDDTDADAAVDAYDDVDAEAEAGSVLGVRCELDVSTKRKLLTLQGDPGGATSFTDVHVFATESGEVRVVAHGGGSAAVQVVTLWPSAPAQDVVESLPSAHWYRGVVRRTSDRLTFAVGTHVSDDGGATPVPIELYDLVDGAALSEWIPLGTPFAPGAVDYPESELTMSSRGDGSVDFLIEGHKSSPTVSELLGARWREAQVNPVVVESLNTVHDWQIDQGVPLAEACHWGVRTPAGVEQITVREATDGGMTHEKRLLSDIAVLLAGETPSGAVAVLAASNAFDVFLGVVDSGEFTTFDPQSLMTIPATDPRLGKVALDLRWYADQLVGMGSLGLSSSETLNYFWLDVMGNLRGYGELGLAEPSGTVRAGEHAMISQHPGGGDFALAWVETMEVGGGGYDNLWFATVKCSAELAAGEP